MIRSFSANYHITKMTDVEAVNLGHPHGYSVHIGETAHNAIFFVRDLQSLINFKNNINWAIEKLVER